MTDFERYWRHGRGVFGEVSHWSFVGLYRTQRYCGHGRLASAGIALLWRLKYRHNPIRLAPWYITLLRAMRVGRTLVSGAAER